MQQHARHDPAPDNLQGSFMAPMDNDCVFEIRGPDTDRFLQGQVTCDIRELTLKTSLPGAACNPKGRAYALFRLLRVSDDCIMLRLPHHIADEVSDQLKKYLAFFKAEMAPAADWSLIGIVGSEAASAFTTNGTGDINSVQETEGGYLITVPPLPDGTPRFEFWHAGDPPEMNGNVCAGNAWYLSEIRSGVPTLSETTAGAYIPLNLNLHAIGGVSFQKGCYTGQEVIARMHHLGQLKKSLFRLRAANADETPTIGDSLVDGDGSKLGAVTDCMVTDTGNSELLAVLAHRAREATITLADQPAASVMLAPMGYSIPEREDTVDNL